MDDDVIKYLLEVIQLVRGLIVEDTKLRDYIRIFDEEINRGLTKETCDEATVKSIVTYVNKLPTGNEEGDFISLDFSGPTINLMLVTLKNRECNITRKTYDIPEKYWTGKSIRLFHFIGKCLVNFLCGINLKVLRIPVGITFGFPIDQTSLQECRLLRWTKGFECDDLIGKNVFAAFRDSFRKFPELRTVYIIGILNDAVAAVLACAWKEPTCMIGTVIGFGASCCYVEKVSRVTKYDAETYNVRNIYINIESADLGMDGCLDYLRTEFDKQLDEESKNPGSQLHDKLTSIAFLSELTRLVLVNCIENNAILDGVLTDELSARNALTLDHMIKIESDPDTCHRNCRAVLRSFGYVDPSDEDCFQVQFICRCVSRRSANLIAAQMATVINRINAPTVTIAMDGDLVRNYPNFRWYLNRKISQLKRESCEFQIKDLEEPGLGPVVMAALFGDEVMNREEKFRHLPGFPMDKCHFAKKQDPPKDPCKEPEEEPLPIETCSADFGLNECCEEVPPPCPEPKPTPCQDQTKKCGRSCKGYSEM